VKLTFFNDDRQAETTRFLRRFTDERVLPRLHAVHASVMANGAASMSTADDPLVSIGMETTPDGRATRNCYGVFGLCWEAAGHPEWAAEVAQEVGSIRTRIQQAHGVPLRYVIWAGMGGSIEDKTMYQAAGLLRGGPTFYPLDSTDPAKLKAILDNLERRSRRPLRQALRSTLVVGMALGMTSYEPVINLEKLSSLFDRLGIDSRANFLYLTLPGSLLDQFASARGYQRVALQMDGDHTTAGRHSGPLTRGALYPLALAGVDIHQWIRGTLLDDREIAAAWKLSSFLHAQGVAGRDKVTLILPRAWGGAGIWTKQDFEESLGKSEALGIKIVVGEQSRRACYHAAKDSRQDRVFLAIRLGRGESGASIRTLVRAGYPLAVVEMPARISLSRYMQFVHYAVFGVAYLRAMNFVTQPSVELYKTIAGEIYADAKRAGGVSKTSAWCSMMGSERQSSWRRRLTLYYDTVNANAGSGDAAARYASLIRQLYANKSIEYAELTFFGDLRLGAEGRAMRATLERGADRVFRRALRMPVDVYEGPAMNHSYHEMIIGHGRCLSTVLLSRKQASIKSVHYTSEYHVSQFLATRMALARRNRPVVAIIVNDLSERSRAAMDDFFGAVARHLKG
jgi:glucose-6-phosphate isomerase